jgi:hypothetical protein
VHIDTLVQRLSADGPAEQRPDGWLVCCPVHGDRHPSLLVSVTADRKAVLHCRSQACNTAAILGKCGLDWADLFHVDGEVTAAAAVTEELSTADIAALGVFLDRAQAAYRGSLAARYALERFGVTVEMGQFLGLGFDDGSGERFAYVSKGFSEFPRLVVPFYGRDGVPRGAQGRDVSGADPNRWAGLTNPVGTRWSHLAWFRANDPGPILVTEGPGDALAVAAAGYAAVAVAGASHARSAATAEAIASGAQGRDVVLAGDADTSGQQFNAQLAERLGEHGVTAKVLALPGGVTDIGDWYAHSGETFAAELSSAVTQAPPWGTWQGDPAALLEEVRGFLRRFLVIEPEIWFDVITLWIAATYFVRASESADVAPRLGFMSTVAGSGKTLALDLVCRVARGRLAVDPTAASVLRAISAMSYEDGDPNKPDTPVPLGIDEVDNLYASRASDNGSITSILNSGYRRGNEVIRADSENQKKALEYDTFAPVVWAGLARAALPDALLSRTFVVTMQQALPQERPESFRPRRHGPAADELAEQIAGWVASVADDDVVSDVLDQAESELAEVVSNRDLELWSLISLPAVMAGGHWPARASAACEELRDAGKDEAESISVRFLRATRDVYRAASWGRGISARVVFRSVLAERVIEADAIFGRWGRGQGIDDEHVRSFLAEMGVRPVPVRVGKETGRGFRWADLQPQWDRYLGSDEPEPVAE